jgi:hypothetical protein
MYVAVSNSMKIDVKLVSTIAYDYWLEIRSGLDKPFFAQTSGFFQDPVRGDSIQDAPPLNDDVRGSF